MNPKRHLLLLGTSNSGASVFMKAPAGVSLNYNSISDVPADSMLQLDGCLTLLLFGFRTLIITIADEMEAEWAP